MKSKTLFVFLTLFSYNSWAVKFLADFVELELPDGWECRKEELDWICQPKDPIQQSEVFISIINKNLDTSVDSISKYEEHLKTPREIDDAKGGKVTSTVKYVKKTKLQNKEFVDALHLNGEIPGFFTRFLATTEQKIAVLISYSIAESVYSKHALKMDKLIQSIKIQFDDQKYRDLMNQKPESLLGKAGPQNKNRPNENLGTESNVLDDEDESQGPDILVYIIGALALGVGVMFFMGRKNT